MQYELGIIGAGNMAEAIVRGVVRAGLFSADRIIAADVSAERRDFFANQLHVKAVEQNIDVARQASVLLLSVKPQQMASALATLGPATDPKTLIISIAAGVSSAFIEKNLGGDKRWRVIRCMPNTPMLVGAGMAGIARGANATADDIAIARRIFESAAEVIEVDEDKIDAVTAMSGSGPAYFFYLVEQMVNAGVELGLTAEQSRLLSAQTALGAAKMLMASSDSPEELRRKVTSPGGTTHAAVSYLESHAVGAAIVEAIKAAQRRGRELGQ
ncbi:MAG TPA: pyrroline-5-carboxylate reductase [Tepidisphaeraceae bacterium]|jgi:pyrroline-5-carboxylate reductase|nr:pyrroline-5-carboxylate reductase [Tepidisphaeraceae bacterium]